MISARPGDYLANIRQMVDAEARIAGLSEANMKRCAVQYLESEERCDTMLHAARKMGIRGFLHIPIILLMVCVIFDEKEELPQNRTELVGINFSLHSLYD